MPISLPNISEQLLFIFNQDSPNKIPPLLILVIISPIKAFGGPQAKRSRNNTNTWYPADDQGTLFKRKRNAPKPSTGRKSIEAGSVVILLSGRHRGRRVVVLKTLESGNLLVTGPYKINGVPLKRVNPAYVISTSTKVSVDGVSVNIKDDFFKKQRTWT